ncbi:hypothetical protein EG338_07555 [Kaistella haifensis]|nr:hypothetical protein EG338_07555 [Kaistella haifensis]
MKKILLFTLLISSFGFAQKSLVKNFDSLDENFKKKFKVETDVFENSTIIYEKKSAYQNIRIKPYLIIKNGSVYYRVSFMYKGYDWLNFDAFKFLVDDKVLEIPIGKTRKEISNDIKAVETTDILLTDSEINVFRQIGNAKTPVNYRISGDKNVDLKLYENYYINYITDLYFQLTE